MQVDRAARRVEASARDQLIRDARALSGLRPAPPPQFGIGGSCPSRSDGPPVAADLPRRVGIREEGAGVYPFFDRQSASRPDK